MIFWLIVLIICMLISMSLCYSNKEKFCQLKREWRHNEYIKTHNVCTNKEIPRACLKNFCDCKDDIQITTSAPDVQVTTSAPDVQVTTSAPDVQVTTSAPDVQVTTSAPDVQVVTPTSDVSSGKWEGWATTTFVGPADTTGRFCGEWSPDLDGGGYQDQEKIDENYMIGASIPWPILCKENKNKSCLLNRMCPKCIGMKPGTTCKDCNGTMSLDGVVSPSNKEANCDIKDINKNGICYEIQVLKDKYVEGGFNPTKIKTYDNNMWNNENGIDINSLEVTNDKFPILKLVTGCGGNCGPGGRDDCINHLCDTGAYPNVCDAVAKGEKKCKYLKTIRENNWQLNSNQEYKDIGSGPLPFDKDGNKLRPEGDDWRNWCTGSHMHFDLGYNGWPSDKNINENSILRYRRIKCPETKSCKLEKPCDENCKNDCVIVNKQTDPHENIAKCAQCGKDTNYSDWFCKNRCKC